MRIDGMRDWFLFEPMKLNPIYVERQMLQRIFLSFKHISCCVFPIANVNLRHCAGRILSGRGKSTWMAQSDGPGNLTEYSSQHSPRMNNRSAGDGQRLFSNLFYSPTSAAFTVTRTLGVLFLLGDLSSALRPARVSVRRRVSSVWELLLPHRSHAPHLAWLLCQFGVMRTHRGSVDLMRGPLLI